jgi:2-C-methyl-D-erythritol 4-phosphate cytidylyltransferase
LALALIVAAGRGERLGREGPKALAELAGRSLLEWSVELMLGIEQIEHVIVALPPGVAAPPGTIGVQGGAVRSQSVARALAAAGAGATARGAAGKSGPRSGGREGSDLVVVHDAARPLATSELVRRTLGALAADDRLDAAIAAAPVSDTIKRVSEGIVVETLDRTALWAVQTPQAFRRRALEHALDVPQRTLARATDDAWLIERAGGRVAIVPASGENLKITTPLDLDLAGLLIARRG